MFRFTGLACWVAFLGAPLFAEDKAEDKAKAVVVELLKAVKAEDHEAVLKLVDVPFAENKGETIYENLDELKKHIREKLKEVKGEKLPTAVSKVETWSKVKEGVKDEEGKKIVEKLEPVFGKEGFVVSFEEGDVKGTVLVSIKNGKARIVGVK